MIDDTTKRLAASTYIAARGWHERQGGWVPSSLVSCDYKPLTTEQAEELQRGRDTIGLVHVLMMASPKAKKMLGLILLPIVLEALSEALAGPNATRTIGGAVSRAIAGDATALRDLVKPR